MNSSLPVKPVTASLDDPFYYRTNFRFVLAWVAERHGDLLDEAEHAFLSGFAAMPESSQALLVRMVMRKGEDFRTSRLCYPEIGDTEAALAPLAETGLVDADPVLSLAELFRQLRLAELRIALAGEIAAKDLPAAIGKNALYETLAPRLDQSRKLDEWWPEAPDRVVRLTPMETCDRLRLMFFGNLRQDWAEFVLAELGVQRFERVPFTADSRAFRHREEVDAYLRLHRLRERLDAAEPVAALIDALPSVPEDNAWLLSRHQRLCLALGRQAEREGEIELALALYAQAGWPKAEQTGSGESRIRHLRLLERQGRHAEAHELAEALAMASPGEAEAQALGRLRPRLRRRLNRAQLPREEELAIERWDLVLPGFSGRVEGAVADHLYREAGPVVYVENALITGLFGLLCWEAIFAPLPGAFFHPFHSGPADLYREDFVARRRESFDTCLARLEDGSYQEQIRSSWAEKHGLASPFVHWSLLDESLIDLALACLPAAHLKACFERLLGDLKANRAGLPDLIQFLPEAPEGELCYRLIEVKGPGDRLQDNQRRWLAFFQKQEIPAVVCHVTWQEAP